MTVKFIVFFSSTNWIFPKHKDKKKEIACTCRVAWLWCPHGLFFCIQRCTTNEMLRSANVASWDFKSRSPYEGCFYLWPAEIFWKNNVQASFIFPSCAWSLKIGPFLVNILNVNSFLYWHLLERMILTHFLISLKIPNQVIES